jgi:hypothetical protein
MLASVDALALGHPAFLFQFTDFLIRTGISINIRKWERHIFLLNSPSNPPFYPYATTTKSWFVRAGLPVNVANCTAAPAPLPSAS